MTLLPGAEGSNHPVPIGGDEAAPMSRSIRECDQFSVTPANTTAIRVVRGSESFRLLVE